MLQCKLRVNFHEDYRGHEEVSGPSDRAFGITFSVLFAVAALWPRLHHRPANGWLLAAAGALSACALLRPALLAPANRLWLRISLVLNRVVTPVMSALVFYLVVTPTGWLRRARQPDPLGLRFDPGAPTYWKPRVPPGPQPESMSRQF